MELPYSEKLNIQYLSRLFDNKSECYKLFWFEAIVHKVGAGKEQIFYDELINEMIVSAWYMVSEYHLNLGPSDTLEALVKKAYVISGLKASEERNKILEFLSTCEDKEINKMKRVLTYNVPYRLQAPFLEKVKGKTEWNVSEKKLAEKINQEERLIYYFDGISGMQSSIRVQREWCEYITANQEILKGWIEYNKIMYLQRRNPGVPGIPNKLYPEQERDLQNVKKYWKAIVSVKPIIEIYGENEMTQKDTLSIDHFIPWSYVAHDELWNLSPTTRNINSKKSNNLPNWDKYFKSLSEIQYEAYQMTWKYEHVHKEFERCLNNNVNSEDVKRKLYRKDIGKAEFIGVLEEIMYPVYQEAKRMGFREWMLEK